MSIETYQQQQARQKRLLPVVIISILAAWLVIGASSSAQAGSREQAKRIHDRLAGVPPTAEILNCMELMIDGANNNPTTNDCPDSNTDNDAEGAAQLAMTHPDFYRVTLKNFITPWTNEEQTIFAPLNDYTATVIGIIRDDYDFRRILYDNILYVGSGISPANTVNSNAHHKAMDDQNSDLQAILTETTQPSAVAAAGIMSTRQGAKAFFVDGTNRAMFRFTLLNHLCADLEQIKDTTRSPDRVRQDVSRSPGGDSRIYMNACVGCHAGMDPMTQAFAYYDYEYPLDADNNNEPLYEQGQIVFNTTNDLDPGGADTGTRVQYKYHINEKNFEYGYRTPNDSWDNYWRAGPNSVMGWGWATGSTTTGTGSGAASMGRELADSYAFAQCQVEKVFKNVCLRSPANAADRTQIDAMITNFSAGYNLKNVFAESALYCRGS
jgi:hypothetical protein